MKMNLTKILSIVLIAFTVMVLVLFALGRISSIVFLIYLAINALIAYKVIPKIRNVGNKKINP